MTAPTERVGSHGPATFAGKSQSDPAQRPTWYTEEVEVPADGRQLLEDYSGVPPFDVVQHVRKIRDRAFDVWSYACIGQLRFLSYNLPNLPFYEPVISKLRQGGTILDVGCCFGQLLRFLTHREQIPGQQLYGFDLEPAFINFGYELFWDQDRFGATFLSGDLLADHEADGAQQINSLEGQMDVVHASSVLHIWAWDDMLTAAKRLASFTRPVKGSLIVGTQMGSINAGEYPMPTSQGSSYRHNEASMQRFWHQVGNETSTGWKVSCGLYMAQAIKENKKASFADPGMRMIWFVAERL